MRFPTELARAARLVANAKGLPRNWLNGAVTNSTPTSATKLTPAQSRLLPAVLLLEFARPWPPSTGAYRLKT